MKKVKLIKDKCEVEGCTVTDPKLLELHHIVPRTDINTSNHNMNLAILCANHHALVDQPDKFRIIGIYPSTKGVNHRVLVYELYGKKNIEGIDEPYFTNKPTSFSI